MIHSMTAFARIAKEETGGQLTCDLRSVNHRYLETHIMLSERLSALEMPIRDYLRQHIKRGKIDCAIHYRENAQAKAEAAFTVNTALVAELAEIAHTIGTTLKEHAAISPADIWNFPGVLEKATTESEPLQTAALALLEQTVHQFIMARAREGEALQTIFLQKTVEMQEILSHIKERLPTVIHDAKERLIQRFKEASLTLDENRLAQEMVLFAQKIDVTEEMDRLETHLTEMNRVLKKGGVVGRQCDFLLQELNREANTLGSKSVDAKITHHTVTLKVLIEQIREQVQNVE